MAKLAISTFLSLDGVMQAPGGPNEDTSGGFPYGGWTVPYADEDMGRIVTGWFERASGFVLGRRTYEIFAGHWPKVTDEGNPIAGGLNNLPKYVASTTLDQVGWNNSTLLRGDVSAAVRRLKEETEGELQIHGSGALARSLMGEDLIDEFRLMVYPVVLGQGVRLFADGAMPTAMKLVDSRTTGAGVAVHTYRLAGRPTFGSFELEE
ncbi:dihydrofolate reductase family protein [Streptomyces palmae]|uniref:Dihydrofolate reductase n=1 Tax=Streptomyces palmae TaxID=1701085 RepID=A0A4Z0GI33_9ACTN|nr:dihydrofolate reductase family protein [Streptomyces palmae]TGA95269.1 dihydrofolate reductase [Streptomyces palmae]